MIRIGNVYAIQGRVNYVFPRQHTVKHTPPYCKYIANRATSSTNVFSFPSCEASFSFKSCSGKYKELEEGGCCLCHQSVSTGVGFMGQKSPETTRQTDTLALFFQHVLLMHGNSCFRIQDTSSFLCLPAFRTMETLAIDTCSCGPLSMNL